MSNQFVNNTGLTSEISARTVTRITTFNDPSEFSTANWMDRWVKFQNILFSAAGASSYSGGYYSEIFGLQAFGYYGAVLDLDANIHLIPYRAEFGVKIDLYNRYTTYTLSYTNSVGAYAGGVLAPNGDVHFVPTVAPVGQKVNKYGAVSTYTLVKQNTFSVSDSIGGDFVGGVLSPDGFIHFVPYISSVGQRVNVETNVCETYTIPGSSGGYAGGVLLPNGEIHFIRANASKPGMKVIGNIATTYQIPNNTISGTKGSKINLDGEAPLYGMGTSILASGSLNNVFEDFTTSNISSFTYAPNGYTYISPSAGQISILDLDGNLIQTFSTIFAVGGLSFISSPNGNVYNVPTGIWAGAAVQRYLGNIKVFNAIPLPRNVYLSPYFNKSI